MRLVRPLHVQSRIDEIVEPLGRYSPHQLTLRASILVSGLGAIVAMLAAGSTLAPWLVPITAAVAVVAVGHPDSVMGLVFVLAVAAEWAATVDDHRSPWTLVAALCLLVFHAASALTATAPRGARFHPDVWRRWGTRLAIVTATTAAAWTLTIALTATERHGHGVLAGIGLLTVAAFGWWLLTGGIAARPSRGDGSGATDGGDDGVEQVDEVPG